MRGFTLTEILIIIVIILILILISIPYFRTLQPAIQLSGAVREIVSDLRYAQQMAVTEQIEYGIRFIDDFNEYQIIRYKETEEVVQSKKLPATVVFYEIDGFVENQAIFNPYGAVKESGSIELINTNNEITMIDVRPSGFVRIIK